MGAAVASRRQNRWPKKEDFAAASVSFLERASEGGRVDREAGVIYGVKVLGRVSTHGYEYSEKAHRDAVRLYEGVTVNIDHPDRSAPATERKLADRFGHLENTRLESGGVFADLHYLKAHPVAEMVVECAERFPSKIGLSHNAYGPVKRHGAKQIVESVEHVRSVDLVVKPATNAGLFESQTEGPVPMKLSEIAARLPESHWASKPLREMAGDPVYGDMPVDMPADADESAPDADAEAKAAFRAMVVAAFDDESLDAKATLARIKEILAAQDKLIGTGATPEEEAASEEEEEVEVTESETVADLKRQLAELKADRDARDFLESAGVLPKPHRVSAIAGCREKAAREALAADYKAADRAGSLGDGPDPDRKPNTSKGLLESQTEYPKDAESFAASLR